MGAAVTFVITLATTVAWLLQVYVLNPLGLQFLQTIVFILVIAFLVQLLEIVMKRPSLRSIKLWEYSCRSSRPIAPCSASLFS